jgi:hypothetical protein
VQSGPNGTVRVESPTSKNAPTRDLSPSGMKKRGPLVLQVKFSNGLNVLNSAFSAHQVRGTDPSLISGYLQMSTDGRNWQKRWFAIHKDFVLYSFKAHQV